MSSIETSLHNWEIINNTIWKFEVNPPIRVFAYFLASFSSLFRSNCKLILYFSTMYGYYVPAKLKGPKQLPNCLKIAETSVVLNVFKGASSVMSALTLLPFLSVAQQESSTRKAIFWSVTVYNKQLSSQCNLTAQIEQVQDK